MLNHMLRASAGGSLSLTYITSGGSTADQSSYTFSNVSFGDEDLTREIFIPFNWSSTTSRNVSSVTIGGVAASYGNAFSATTSGCRIAFATVPTGTTGDIVINMSGTCTNVGYGVYRVINRVNRGRVPNDSTGTGISSQSSPLTDTSTTILRGGFGIGVAGVNVNKVYSSNVYTIDNYNTATSSEGWQIIMSYVNTSSASSTPTQSISWSSGTIGVRYGYWAFNG
jgi:hypothetical protein